jgi:hypothetical protein
MLTNYINGTMSKAHYEILPENECYFGKIECLQGVGLMLIHLKNVVKLLELDGLTLNIRKVA